MRQAVSQASANKTNISRIRKRYIMNKRHISIGNWIDRKTSQPKSNLAPISEGISKEGNNYQITDTDNTTIIDGTYPVGTIMQSTTTFTADAPPAAKAPTLAPPPAPKSTKV